MALSAEERAEFVNAYTRALITVWSNEDYAAKLSEEPAAALREMGIDLPAGAEVVVVRAVPESAEPSLDRQVDLYEQGKTTGRYEFHIPESPQVDLAELSEGDLAGVAGGDIYCCCCPCCCS